MTQPVQVVPESSSAVARTLRAGFSGRTNLPDVTSTVTVRGARIQALVVPAGRMFNTPASA